MPVNDSLDSPSTSTAQQPHADTDRIAVTCAVLTISDTRTQATDTSGQLMQQHLTAEGHRVSHYQIVQDDPADIAALVTVLAKRSDIQTILINGGTGIAPRDTTYDAIATLLTKEIPGFGEIFRQLSYAEIGSRAIASRAVAGIHNRTLIFSVPGSSKAVKLALKALILPELRHLTRLLQETSL